MKNNIPYQKARTLGDENKHSGHCILLVSASHTMRGSKNRRGLLYHCLKTFFSNLVLARSSVTVCASWRVGTLEQSHEANAGRLNPVSQANAVQVAQRFFRSTCFAQCLVLVVMTVFDSEVHRGRMNLCHVLVASTFVSKRCVGNSMRFWNQLCSNCRDQGSSSCRR